MKTLKNGIVRRFLLGAALAAVALPATAIPALYVPSVLHGLGVTPFVSAQNSVPSRNAVSSPVSSQNSGSESTQARVSDATLIPELFASTESGRVLETSARVDYAYPSSAASIAEPKLGAMLLAACGLIVFIITRRSARE